MAAEGCISILLHIALICIGIYDLQCVLEALTNTKVEMCLYK